MAKLKELVIDRSKWYRGKGSEKSKLLTKNGKMCCLGFLTLDCGYKPKDIRNVCDPYEIESHIPNKYVDQLIEKGMLGSNSVVCWKLMWDNDDKSITDKERERCLTKSFKQIGIKPKFIN